MHMKTMIAAIVAVLALAGATVAFADHGHPGKPSHPSQSQKGKGGKAKGKKQSKPDKMTICHRTLSAKKPTVTIGVSSRAWPAHKAHGDTENACGAESQPRGFTRLTTTLAPVAGATGSGSATIDVRVGKNRARVCYTLLATGVDATAAHIHTSTDVTLGGTSFAAGSIVVPFKTPKQGSARGCTQTAAAVGQALLDNPSNFYVNVHSATFPTGQIQGTLAAS
jgi:CHRD domain-containing protein